MNALRNLLILVSAILVNSINYRLPTTIIPDSYQLDLKLTEDNLTSAIFSGSIKIDFYLKENVSTSTIQLHAKNLEIITVQLNRNNQIIEINNNGSYQSDPITDILTLTTATELTNDSYSLNIEYTGILSTKSMNGFYRSEYMEDGVKKYLATTQFESTYARSAFPCFDEPAFKATFSISITYPNGYSALANTPQIGNITTIGDLNRVQFATSPKMSTYLVAFIVSQFDCTNGENVDGTIPTRVCSRNGLENSRNWARLLVPKALVAMEEFTNISYAVSGIGKMDVIAIPDFSAGAMENWGLVTYRETALLWDENESSNYYKQRVATVIAHEFAHQWFGDLVTLKWWSEVFLNEGFATYFEYHAASEIDELKAWQLPQQFVIEQVQTALEIDGTKTSKALFYYIEKPDDISDRFDLISYNKGGSILKMVEHILTTERFKAGLNAYLNAFHFSNTEANDLWSKLDDQATDQIPENINFTTIMDNWTNKAGYPVITIITNGDNITISQKRFLESGSSDDTQWYVPITYYTSTDKNIDTKPKYWLVPYQNLTINNILSGIDWIIFNSKQSGYYRVNYDNQLWSRISTILNQNLTKIDVLNRAQIIDDLFNFAKAKLIDYNQMFEFITFLKNDTDYYSWYAAFRGFTTIMQRINRVKIRSALNDYVNGLMVDLLESVPFNQENLDDQIYSLKQRLALNWACKLGNSRCIDESTRQLTDYISNKTIKISRNLRSVVYCYGLRYSNNTESDWEFLWGQYLNTNVASEQVTLLTALGCTVNNTILRNYLEMAIVNDSQIRIQDVSKYVFTPIYSNSIEGVDVTIQFILDKHQDIAKHFGSSSQLKTLISSLANYLTNENQIDQLRQLIGVDGVGDDVKKSIDDAVNTTRTNLEFTRILESQLINYFEIDDNDDDGGNNGAKINSLSIIGCLVTLLVGAYQFI